MIVSQITHNAQHNPDKVAIKKGSSVLTFAQLEEKITKAASEFQVLDGNLILIRANNAEGLIQFLAGLKASKKVIILPASLSTDQWDSLKETYHAKEYQCADLAQFHLGKIENNDGQIGILTSGSTGNPKIIWKTQENWESAFAHQSQVFNIRFESKVMVVDAMAYSANLNAAIHTLWQGSTLHLTSTQEIRAWGNLIDKEKLDTLYLVPSHARLLLQNRGEETSVKNIITAGEKLDIHTAKLLLDKYPGLLLTEYYGAAELGHISYHQNEEILAHPASVGKAFPGVEISIDGEEIQVNSPYISPEYHEKRSVQDLGYFEEGRLLLKGRAGRVFNRRGINVYAEEIENLATTFGGIQSAALIPTQEQKLTLFYCTSNNTQVSSQDLQKYLSQKLPSSKMPNHLVVLDEMPHSEAGKVDFKALSKMNESAAV